MAAADYLCRNCGDMHSLDIECPKPSREALAVAAEFKLPSEDGFWHHEELGPVHDDDLNQYIRPYLLKALDKLGL